MKKNRQVWISTAVFLLFFALSLTSLTQKSPTFDEQGFITRGLAYLRGDNRHMRVGHPLGLNALNAAFLVSDETVNLPVDDPSWQKTSFHRPSELFLWEIGNDVERIMFLARLPTVFLGLLLTAVSSRWAFELTRNRWAGLLTLTLLAFDPNILAHTRLTTTDLGLAAFTLLAGYTLWRFLKRPSFPHAFLAGIAFGLLQNTKFTAGLFVPLFALVILVGIVRYWRLQRGNNRALARFAVMLLLVYPLAGFFTLWVTYGFQIGTLPANLPSMPQLSGLTLPLAHHLEQLLDIGGRLQKTTPAFLLGDYSDTGWTHYFPVTFLLKTPLPTLILLGWALTVSCWLLAVKRFRISSDGVLNAAALLIPPLGYFAIALTTNINLGYRHLLPILPYFAVFIGSRLPLIHRRPRIVIVGLIGWLIAITLWIHPHYLAYFNVLAGGPDNGWKVLVDSNIDWGQDLGALKGWMDENEVEQVYLSYFGEAHPAYYGINYIGLDSWPPRLMDGDKRPFYPPNPAPGIYAISATMLQSVMSADHDQFAYFRDRDPIAKLGYSIFLYEVEPYGEPVDLLLSSVQIDEIAPEDYALMATNDVTPHWFDPEQSWLVIEGENWAVFSQDTVVIDPFFESYANNLNAEVEAVDYTLYSSSLYPGSGGRIETFTNNELDVISLVWAPEHQIVIPPNTISLRTGWVSESLLNPVKIFVHLTNQNGDLISQWDGIGAAWEGWHWPNVLLQNHVLPIPAGTPSGTYQLWTGLYNPETGERWQSDNGDRYFIGEVELP